VSSTVTGADKFLAKIGKTKEDVPKALAQSCYRWSAKVGAVAQRRCPVQYGRLRASFAVELPKFTGNVVEIRFGFGTEYALAVHNRTGVRHPVGQDHFLSSAFDEAKGNAMAWIAADCRALLKR
jgi:hypothetical protein